jgi:hypothetical protein
MTRRPRIKLAYYGRPGRLEGCTADPETLLTLVPYTQQAYGQAPPPAAGGAGGWQELRDEQARVYYFNAATGVSQWERPASM